MNPISQISPALRGRKLLIVGGNRREAALRRLIETFDLADVIHCPTRKVDSSVRCFASRIRQPGIVLVVWVLGLSRTHHGEQLHDVCRSLGIPWIDFFRIPHPNALATRIADLHLLDAIRCRGERLSFAANVVPCQIGGAA